MGKQLQLIFIAFIVDFSSIHVQPYRRIDQADVQLNNEDRNKKNFQILFDSISMNDVKNSEKYREFLKQEVAVGQKAFDLMKNQFRIAQARDADKKANVYGGSYVGENVVARKREANANNTCNASSGQFTAEDERTALIAVEKLLEDAPANAKVVSVKRFCINRCLLDSISQEPEPTESLPEIFEHIPDERKPLFTKLAHTMSKCVILCNAKLDYRDFWLNLLTLVLTPDIVPDERGSCSLSSNSLLFLLLEWGAADALICDSEPYIKVILNVEADRLSTLHQPEEEIEMEFRSRCNRFVDQHVDVDTSSDPSVYRQALNLTMELLRKQKVHIDKIKERCNWLGKSGIMLKKLPQILYHASQFYDEEANTRKEILESDPEGHNKVNPFSLGFVTQLESFLTEIGKFIDAQTTLTPDEVSSMKQEVSAAREEFKTARKVIDEKVKKLDKFLAL